MYRRPTSCPWIATGATQYRRGIYAYYLVTPSPDFPSLSGAAFLLESLSSSRLPSTLVCASVRPVYSLDSACAACLLCCCRRHLQLSFQLVTLTHYVDSLSGPRPRSPNGTHLGSLISPAKKYRSSNFRLSSTSRRWPYCATNFPELSRGSSARPNQAPHQWDMPEC